MPQNSHSSRETVLENRIQKKSRSLRESLTKGIHTLCCHAVTSRCLLVSRAVTSSVHEGGLCAISLFLCRPSSVHSSCQSSIKDRQQAQSTIKIKLFSQESRFYCHIYALYVANSSSALMGHTFRTLVLGRMRRQGLAASQANC